MNNTYMKLATRSIILSFFVLALVGCEKDIEIGASIVDQDLIKKESISTQFEATSEPVEEVLASGDLQKIYLLGVYSKNHFGTVSGGFVSQIALPAVGNSYSYGKSPIIDSVLLTIPYAVSKDKDKKYVLDSIYGNKDIPFKINVHEVKTFLNSLNPEKPSEAMIYKSNKNFAKEETPLYSGSFQVNKNDTVAYINHYDSAHKKFKTDTIKEKNAVPFIRIPLDKNLIKQKFIDMANSSDFASQESFKHYFKGLYINAEVLNSKEAHILSLPLANAKMRIFYSSLVDESSSQDLNGNGTKGEKDVRISKFYSFPLSGVKSSIYKRNLEGAYENNKRLYVQGASGSKVIADVFSKLNIADLRKSPHLVTQANLVFYVDEALSGEELPEYLFIYNNEDNKKLIDSRYSDKKNLVGGKLEKLDDGKPYRYVFKITRHIADLLKTNNTKAPAKLAIKAFNPTDLLGSKVLNYNWNVKGVVLHGSNSEVEEKRPTFEIFYSGLNE